MGVQNVQKVQAAQSLRSFEAGQVNLLDLFERQFAQAFSSNVLSGGAAPVERLELSEPGERLNPFRKQWGACAVAHEGRADERVYWCHKCGKKFCWNCFEQHSD